jgi:hypothetical protein
MKMKPLRFVSLLAAFLLVALLAGCAGTPTATVSMSTATLQPYPAAMSPTAATAPTGYPPSATATEAMLPTVTATLLPRVTPSPSATAVIAACPGAPAIALSDGQSVMVSVNPPVPSRLREQPGVQAKLVGLLDPGEYVTVTEGPRCANGYTWWKVQSGEGLTGWTVEGDNTGYWLVTPTPVSGATPNPTSAASASVWEIWFFGFSCDSMNLCSGPGMPYHYYSIMSDGSGLKELQLSTFPPLPILPKGVPAKTFPFPPQPSPDGLQLIYGADDGNLYLVEISSGKRTKLYQADRNVNGIWGVRVACWSPDGEAIRFVAIVNQNGQPEPTVLSVNPQGGGLAALRTIDSSAGLLNGDCAPDGRHIVVVAPVSDESGEANRKAGLYVVDLDTGSWRQILPNFSVGEVRVMSAQH